MMRILSALFLATLLATKASAAEPFARATIEDGGAIVAGQQIHVTVDVFAPNFFTSAPQFPLFDLPGAIVTLPDIRAQNLVQTVDGIQYSGIRRTYAVVPETSGRFTLPPVVIEFAYSDDGKTVKGEARLPPTSFEVAQAPGSGDGALVFAASNLTLTQSFEPDPAKLKAGDALVRTITILAGDTQAMMIPALKPAPTQGLRVYARQPTIDDGAKDDAGEPRSRRTETITYVADTPGSFEIPLLNVSWFDIAARTEKIATLPATTLTVAAAPSASQELAPVLQDEKPASRNIPASRIAGIAAFIVIATLVPWLLRRWFRSRIAARKLDRENAETTRFKQLNTALGFGDASSIYRSLEVWTKSAGYRLLSDWVAASHDDGLAQQMEALERELFSGSATRSAPDRAALAQAVARARRQQNSAKRRPTRNALPALNPR